MKKIKILCFLLGMVLILFVYIRKEQYIKDNDYLYEIATNYLLEENLKEDNPDHDVSNYHFFLSYDKFGITKKGDYKYVYMWVLGESYGIKDSVVTELSGYSVFHKFKIKDDKVISVETPKDGSLYSSSVRKMTPNRRMAKKVLNYELKLTNDKSVSEYYSNSLYTFKANVLEVSDNYILVDTLDKTDKFDPNTEVIVFTNETELYKVSQKLEITFNGNINDSEPCQIDSSKIVIYD